MNAARYNSLTLRLTLFIAIASTLVFLGLGFLIGKSVETHFEEQDQDVLTGKMKLVQHALKQTQGTGDLETLRRQLADSLVGHHGLSIKVVGPASIEVFSTPGADIPVDLLIERLATPLALEPVKWISRSGKPFRGIVSYGPRDDTSARPFVVMIATDISHHEHYMESFRSTLWMYLVLAALIMGIGGWLAVRRGLMPLQSIRREAASITARRLDARIPADAVPVELAELAETLNDMLGRLEESFRRLSDFSSDLAHELRTPVSNLLTETQVTLAKARTAEQYQDVLASNSEELERLSSMISDMLFLAKSDNNLMIPHIDVVDLSVEVESLFDYYGVLADDAGVKLSTSGSGAVRGDRLMLRRAISNLLSNAIRHTPRHGEVVVRIVTDENDDHRVEVENSGDSIPAEHLPRLFDRFYRIDSSRHRSSEGAGLGLAITQSIMQAHGGSASANSENDKTTFTLIFPADRTGAGGVDAGIAKSPLLDENRADSLRYGSPTTRGVEPG
jgi:two-component system, OmpR family, heavy metal sensor histidine kinase CusS